MSSGESIVQRVDGLRVCSEILVTRHPANLDPGCVHGSASVEFKETAIHILNIFSINGIENGWEMQASVISNARVLIEACDCIGSSQILTIPLWTDIVLLVAVASMSPHWRVQCPLCVS